MNKTRWVRILVASAMLAFLGACADMPAGKGTEEAPVFPIG